MRTIYYTTDRWNKLYFNWERMGHIYDTAEDAKAGYLKFHSKYPYRIQRHTIEIVEEQSVE